MPYWVSRDEAVDDFEGYDPTPYSGGYDLSLTYGRPLQPSDETCYPVSATGGVDSERPHYSGSQTSAFETDNPLKGDCYGLLHKPQPAYGFPPQPLPASNMGYPSYGYQSHGYGGGCGPGVPGASDHGSGFGGRPQFQEYGSAYGQGYVERPQHQEYRSEHGSGYESGRKPQYGSGYGQQEGSFGYCHEETKHYGEEGYGASGYRRSEEEVGGDGGYRRNNDYIYGGNTSYMRPSYGVGEEESGRHRTLGYGEEGSGKYKKSSYGDEYASTGYRKPTYYGGEEGEGYGHSKYGNDSDDVEKKHSYQKHHHRHY